MKEKYKEIIESDNFRDGLALVKKFEVVSIKISNKKSYHFVPLK